MIDPTRQHLLKKAAGAEAAAARERRDNLKRCLPHLFGQKWYAWAKGFFDSTNRMNLLCAANQISKSSTQIRKAIHWATCVKLWPLLWKSKPVQFWYLYPSKDVATSEWETKIKPEFMPAGEFKNHPIYGWTEHYEKKHIDKVVFNTGVMIVFKSYAQDVHSLQSGTVHAIFCDEELPEELYSELKARLFATDGHFHMVFTATRNQLMWLQAIEGKDEAELFPDAFKLQVSMYDCQTYMDGSPGAYSEEKIKRVIADCKSQAEVDRRVKGMFVTEIGRVLADFDPTRHFMKPRPIPRDWLIFGAIDYGSGGSSGHPSANSFLAVRPDFRLGWLFKGWRGDDIQTTAGDAWDRYVEIRGNDRCMVQVYDWAAKDVHTIAERQGESLTKAEKSHDIGEGILNTLFKAGMLYVFDTPELRKFGTEAMTVMKATAKKHRKDDLLDTARYNACAVPWDWTALQGVPTEDDREKAEKEKPWTEEDQVAWDIAQRRGEKRRGSSEEGEDQLEDEIAYWNSLYG